jgi:hypothetical protein
MDIITLVEAARAEHVLHKPGPLTEDELEA